RDRPGRRAPAQRAEHGARERVRGPRGRRDRARRVGRRHRVLPLRAEGDGQHRHRGSGLPAGGRGRRHRHRPRRADRRRGMARGRARAAAARTGLPRRHVRTAWSRRGEVRDRDGEGGCGFAAASRSRRLRGDRVAYRLGVDVGGTFTDLLLVHDETGGLHRVKTPSTPADPAEGVLNGVRRICDESGVSPSDLAYVLHGTTVATNALLEAKGARVGLITTQGFGQILHLARSQTPGPLAGWIIMIKPDPPAALEDTREAKERMGARGDVVEPVDREQVREIVRDLVDSGVESLTVSLINSYANPAHEREIAALIEELHPGFPVTISSDVLPEFREYERTLTACMNSYVRPKVQAYVEQLESSLRDVGVKGELNLLRSDAGLMTTRVASERPIYGILSGPSGGVAGALAVAVRAGFDDVLTFDMGGTSTDVALCEDGQPTIERQTEVPYGWGLPGEVIPIKVPSVNV